MRRKKIISFYYHNKKIINDIIANGFIKGIAVLISFLTTPAYMRYFNDENVLGVWLTLISILTTISVLDFGLGNGLRNRLTEAFAKKEKTICQQLISSCYFIITIISILILIIGWMIITVLPWNEILGISNNTISNSFLTQCIKTIFFGIVLQMILKLVNSILFAKQKAGLVSFLPMITNLLMLLFVCIVPSKTVNENLLLLSKAYCLFANTPYFLATLILFRKNLKEYMPRLEYVNISTAKDAIKLGILFFYLSLMSLMIHNTNEILISVLFESSKVVEYQVYNKIFYLVTTMVNVLMIPLWSAVTKAKAESNYIWMKKLHTLLCIGSVITLIGCMAIIPFMQNIVNLWLGDNAIQINWKYCIPFVIYVAEKAFNSSNATIANGANWIKAQIIMAPIGVVLNIICTILLKELFQNWNAITIANIISSLPVAIVQFIYLRKKFRCILRDKNE